MCKRCEHEQYQRIIEELLRSPYYDFANYYLESCLDWVIHHRHITPKQVMAVDRIRSSIYSHLDDADEIDGC